MPASKLIELRQLSKAYQEGNSTHQVLDSINLEIPKGEFLALLGTSGSGKSTLLNLLSGIDISDSGEILIDGQDIVALDENQRTLFRREHIGFVCQFFFL